MKIKKSKAQHVFDACNVIFMLLLMVITLYPFLYIIFASFSDAAQLLQTRGLLLKPAGFSLDGYRAVMKNESIFTGYKNTLTYLIVGTTLNILVTSLLAYTLSRRRLKHTKPMMKFIIFTMFVNGGMVPTYLVVRSVGLLNTMWSVILPSLVSTYNLIVLRTAFEAVPDSLEESARIDGANDLFVLFRIVLPLSKASLAVMVLFYGVSHWNSWFNAMIYLRNAKLYPLQLILREILLESSNSDMMFDTGAGDKASLETVIKYATVVVSTVPVLLIYPFLQKYFVKGVMVGAVKG